MIIYSATKSEFVEDVRNDCLVSKLLSSYREKIGGTSENEILSWNNSLRTMRDVVDDPCIPNNCGIAIEYNIPYTSKRVDFIITGQDEEKVGAAVIVELKQRQEIKLSDYSDDVVITPLGRGLREHVHPSYQAYSYATDINNYNATIQDEHIALYPCAYLHNYFGHGVDDPIYKSKYVKDSPVFLEGDGPNLRKYISKYIKFGDNEDTIYKINNGRLRPSKSLQDCLDRMIKGNQEFIMIDEQKVVFETALSLYKKTCRDGKKRVLIVEGGPGTGKSVLAVNLLVKITEMDGVCSYVTKNSAPRNIYSKKLRGDKFDKATVEALFKSSGVFYNVPSNTFDCLICDEAHRLNNKSGLFKNKGNNQIKEIINASRFSIFFIDEHQRVSIDDIGSTKEIESCAKEYAAEVTKKKLESQFRCNGSDGYLAWVDNTLQIRNTANFDGCDDYEFKVFDDPVKLFDAIKEKNAFNNKSRIVAGYCWDWISDGKNDSNVKDINIGNFHASWNLRNTDTWAIDKNSINEVGCIHTCQGIEFDYIGVIIGEDIGVTDDGVIYTNWHKRAKTDQSLKGLKKIEKENIDKANEVADEIIRNTYRTLLTRGMKGCYVYCVDEKLGKYLEACFRGERSKWIQRQKSKN